MKPLQADGRGRRAIVSPKLETSLPLPVRFLAAWIGVWLGRSQQQLIEYQREEIQLLRQKLGGRRLRFSDGDRRRLAVLGRRIGRRALGQVATVATPDTILRWYRELVAKKYDGSAKRGAGATGTVTGGRPPAGAHGHGGPELGLHATAWRAQEHR